VKTRAQMPALALATIVSHKVSSEKPTDSADKGEYDDDQFNTINLLGGLFDGMLIKIWRYPSVTSYLNAFLNLSNILQFYLSLCTDPTLKDASKILLLPTSRIYEAAESRRQSIYPNTPGPTASQPLKRSFRKILPVKSALNVRMRTTSVSPLDNVLMMSVELENNTDAGTSFVVEGVKVDLLSAMVTQFDWGGKKV
jgi:hypothetical protein